MTLLLATSLLIDFTRTRSPGPGAELKQLIAPFLLDPKTHLGEPVPFEVLRSARPEESPVAGGPVHHPALPHQSSGSVEAGHVPEPALPSGGNTVLSLDLLVAAVALHHGGVLASFNIDFEAIAALSELRL